MAETRIPRGMEVMIIKSAVDPEFKTQFLTERSAAATRISLELSPSEKHIIDTIPESVLLPIINRTKVRDEYRATCMGKAAVAMLLALTMVVTSGCLPVCTGSRPDLPEDYKTNPPAAQDTQEQLKNEPQ